MQEIVVIKIRNSSVSSVYKADSVENAKGLVKDLFFAQFNRSLNEKEEEELELFMELSNDEEHDNYFTFSIAFVNG